MLGSLVEGPSSAHPHCEEQSGGACQVPRAHGEGLTIKSRFFFLHLDPSCLASLFFSYSPLHAHTSETIPILENFVCEVKAAAVLKFSEVR